MQRMRGGAYSASSRKSVARRLTVAVQILEEGKAFELGMYPHVPCIARGLYMC